MSFQKMDRAKKTVGAAVMASVSQELALKVFHATMGRANWVAIVVDWVSAMASRWTENQSGRMAGPACGDVEAVSEDKVISARD